MPGKHVLKRQIERRRSCNEMTVVEAITPGLPYISAYNMMPAFLSNRKHQQVIYHMWRNRPLLALGERVLGQGSRPDLDPSSPAYFFNTSRHSGFSSLLPIVAARDNRVKNDSHLTPQLLERLVLLKSMWDSWRCGTEEYCKDRSWRSTAA